MDLPAHEVVVIGAGPAGARCAHVLAEAGRDVAILEARPGPQQKPCGGLLNRRAQRFIQQLGGLPAAVRVGANQPALEFPALEYHDLDNRIRARYAPDYRNIDRRAFDDWLIEQARSAGVQLFSNTRVLRLAPADGRIDLDTSQGQLSARWVIDASGGLGLSRRKLTGPAIRQLHAIQGTVELEPAPDAMWSIYSSSYTPFFGWIIPKGQGRFLLGTGLTREGIRRLRDSPGNSPADRNFTWSLLGPLLDYLNRRGLNVRTLDDRPRGTPLCCPNGGQQLWWGRSQVLAVGEAAGLASPFSGEGISYALASAEAAAFALLSGNGAAMLDSLNARLERRLGRANWQSLVGATPWLRPWGLWLLPLHAGSRLAYFPWTAGLDD